MSELSYFHSFSSSLNSFSTTYSIDKIILTGKFVYSKSDLLLRWLSDYELKLSDNLPFGYHFYDLGYYTTLRIGSYYNCFDIKLFYDNSAVVSSSFFLGVLLNSNGKKLEQWKLEFNPNKILPCEFFSALLINLVSLSAPNTVKVKSWDLAVDIPVSRSSLHLLRDDKRRYTQIFNSSEDLTEYLGVRHSHGFVKLYNKTIESCLDCVCTRFEITFNATASALCIPKVPKLYYLGDKQITMNYLSELSQNQRVFFELLLLHPDYINMLDKKGKSKYKRLLLDNSVVFQFDISAFEYLSSKLFNYCLGVVSV